MTYSDRNLAETVQNRARYTTPKCTVPTLKSFPPYFVTGPDDPEAWHYDHQWSDHAGGLKGGRCEKCGKTVKDIRVRINPKTGEPVRGGRRTTLAREIASTPADVPPVHFIGQY